MCDCQEPNTVSSLPSERGHISLISILSLTKLHCTDQSITEDNLKWKKGGKDRYFVLPCVFLLLQAYLVYLYSTVHFCLQKTHHVRRMQGYVHVNMYAHIVSSACLTKAGAAGEWWWNQSVAMETTASHRIPRTMECQNLRLTFLDIHDRNDHTQLFHVVSFRSRSCWMPCVNTLHIHIYTSIGPLIWKNVKLNE